MGQDKQICDECVYLSNVAIGTVEGGQVVCPKCRRWADFKFFHVGGGSTTFRAALENSGERIIHKLDSDDTPIYLLAATSARVEDKLIALKAIQCNICKVKVPTWFLKHNKYLQQYFTENRNAAKKATNKAP